MANRFWVGGNANWDATAGTKWATTSGGAGGSAVPTAADDVFLDNGAGTGNVTISANAVCRSLTCTGYVGILTHNAAVSLTIGDATAGAGNVAFLLVAGMTYTLGSATTSTLVFASTSATQQTITSAGKTMPVTTFQGIGSSYITSDICTTGVTSTWTLTNGILDLNGKAHSIGIFSITGTLARTLTFNGAAITITGGSATVWNATTTTLLTFTPDTGSITTTGAGSTLGAITFAGGGLTYNNVTHSGTFGILSITGANGYNVFTISGGASTVQEVRIASTITLSGTPVFNGNSVANRTLIRSNTIGTSRTISSAAAPTTNGFVDFIDITAAGAGGAWSNSGWGTQACTSITGATPVTTYWVGGTGNSSDATKYASSSGGTANTQRAPLLQDTAIYDANSGSGTLTFLGRKYGNINMTNTTLTACVMNGGFADTFIGGDFILSPTCPLSSGTFADIVRFCGRGSQTLTTAGSTITFHSWNVECGVGTYTLGSTYTSDVALGIILGTLTTNNYAMSILSWSQTGGTTNLGSSIITITSQAAATVWSVVGTINAGTSTIYLTNTSANNQVFAGGAKTYNDLLVSNGTGLLTISSSNTFARIRQDAVGTKTLRLTTGTTTTFLYDNGFPRGTAGNLFTVKSNTDGSAYTVTCPTPIATDYISLRDCTGAGSTPHYAGLNSTNVSGNTNWDFSGAPSGGNFLALL